MIDLEQNRRIELTTKCKWALKEFDCQIKKMLN